MPVVSPDEFARLIGSMDVDSFAAFVADIWTARGWETTIAGTTIRARAGPNGRDETIECLPRRRWRRDRDLPAEPRDVVVAAGDPAGTVPADYPEDVRVLGPAELRGLLLYGIGRETADELFRLHLGRSIWTERADRSRRFQAPTPARVAVVVGLVVLAVAAIGLATSGVGPGTLAANGESGPTATPVAPTTPGDVRSSPTQRYPPGTDSSGLTDLDALVAGHRNAIVNRSFELLLVHQRSADLLAPERRWITSRQTANRLNATHFHYRVTGLEAAPDGNFTLVVYDDYADGVYTYRRIASSGPPSYRRGVVPTAGGDGAFTVVGTAYLRRYLATTESRMELITPTYPALYRVVATGIPDAISGPVADYRAEAVIDEEGIVHRLTVEYRRLDATATNTPGSGNTSAGTEVRFELVYSDIGETDVRIPPWYNEAHTATNGTLDELRSPESLWWSQPIGIDYRDDLGSQPVR